ncbi:polymorphic toxin type 50 domain-containing protein [Helcococcus bovis]|uniref:polymorphic toxin type 50 domain-containing protein n=1 Tax=Helcococcus bovis TaxID=3153252 RepID=UPI0038BBB675
MKKIKSPEYFQKRQAQNMHKQHKKADKYMHILNNEFDKSIDNLKIEINRIIGKVEGLTPQEVRERLSETISNDEYDRLLKLYKSVKDPDVKKQIEKQLKMESIKYRVKRKEAMIQAINRERARLTDTQLTNAKEHLSSVYIDSYQLFTNNRVSISELENVLNSKWNGGNYSSRIWNNQKVMAKSLKSELMQAFISGKTEKQMADILVEYTDYSRHVANRLIRTETSYMVNTADLNDSKRRGIKAKRFEAHLDSRTSRLCRLHNQIIIPIDKIKIGVNAPPLHPYCRSFLSDVLEGWDYETDEELQELIDDSYIENEKQAKKYNDDVMKGKFDSKIKKSTDIEQYTRYKEKIGDDKFKISFEEFEKIKYNKSEEYEKLKVDYRDEKLRERIGETYNLNIHEGRQGKHILGHNNYEGKSYLLEEIDPQELINKYALTGEFRRVNVYGKWTNKEFITANEYIGYVVDKTTGEKQLTKRFSISYSKKKGSHIVPRRKEENYE